MVYQQIKVVLLTIIALFRRALCCFSRRRKLSHDSEEHQHILQAVTVVTVPRNNNIAAATSNVTERDWNSWDDGPRTVDEHIEQYRQRMAKPETPPKEDPEPDFFSDLAPVIKPQIKYYLNDDKTDAVTTDFTRLQAQIDVPIVTSTELEDWEEEIEGGWEELDSEQTKQMIREKRREMRNNRQNTNKTVNYGIAGNTKAGTSNSIGAQRMNAIMQRNA